MRMNICILLSLLLISLIPACFYVDSEIYEVEPIPGDPPVISVTTNLDSLVDPPVNDSLEVIYDVEIEGGDLYYVYAGIDGNFVYESDSTHGAFWINPDHAALPVVDTLIMDFYYSSNSNSLADLVGYEALIKTLKIAVDFKEEPGK
jgi:hypothetical protein